MVPTLLVCFTRDWLVLALPNWARLTFLTVGLVLILAGLLLVVSTIALFVDIGRGTLAPWDPTQQLVVAGPFRYVRNPMITGVAAVLLGEAALLQVVTLFVWFALFVAVNVVYIPLAEEPGLVRRFGDSYREYRRHVPRWIPRSRPWKPGS